MRAFHALSRGAAGSRQLARCCARVVLMQAGGWHDNDAGMWADKSTAD